MTTQGAFRRVLLLAGLLAASPFAAGCPDEPADGDADADGDGGGDGDGDGDGECEPRSCMDIDRACGTYDDGCGETIECTRGCECTAETFADDCPERPCETAVGCEEDRCVYEPVSCGGSPCACRAGDCEEWTLRSCGEGVCTPTFCDPRPVREEGVAHYENACVDAPAAGACGTCGLGRLECDEVTDTFSCVDVTLAGVDPEMVECDSTLPTSSFVFVDPGYDGGESDGSRARPYGSYDEGLSVAWGRDAVGVVVAGSEVTRGSLTLMEGVSVYGGFDGAPHFRVSATARPAWQVGIEHASAEDLAAHRLVGARAHGFEEPTVVSGIAVRTDSLAELEPDGPGLSSYALHVQGSPGLQLVNVVIEAGAAGPGEDGATGDPGPAGDPGGAGGAGVVCACGSGLTGHEACYTTSAAGGAAAAATRCLDFTEPPETAGGNGGGITFDASCEAPLISCATDGAWTVGGERGGTASMWGGGNGFDGDDASSERPIQAAAGVASGAPIDADGELFLSGSPGGDGARGERGAHALGGGGGASGNVDDYPAEDIDLFDRRTCTGIVVGGGGGGGGAGGCGGGGGGGGRAGGVSVALFVARSDGMVLDGCDLRGGSAGGGGQGGEGGLAGAGGAAGAAGALPAGTCSIAGVACGNVDPGRGGAGGDGQPGGRGGNGVGGSSYGAYCFETALAPGRASRFRAGEAGLGGTFGDRPAADGVSVDQHACVSDCGNGTVEPPEACDDGNREDGDGCEADCTLICAEDTDAVGAAFDAAGHCLAGFAGPRDWAAAELACIAAGGHLASLGSAADFATASALFAGTSHWVGLNDRATEGTYTWPSGEALSWTDGLCTGEPRDSEADDCVMSFWSAGSASHCWLVRTCDAPLPYLCELP